MRRKRCLRELVGALLTVAVCAFGAAGCGGASHSSSTAASSSPTSHGNSSSRHKVRIIYIGNAPASDIFQHNLVVGAQQGAQTFGADVTYRSPGASSNDATVMAPLLRNAIAEHPDGIVMWDGIDAALNPLIKQAVQAGIPVVLSNDGTPADAQKTGALTYVGNDEYQYGRLAGQLLGQKGVKHLLYIGIAAGSGAIFDQRQSGVIAGFPGKVTTVNPPITVLTQPTQVKNIILTELQKDPSIDGVLDVGALVTPGEIAAESQLGARAQKMGWATLDLGLPGQQGVKSGQLAFALDQQEYLEGFWPIMVLYQHIVDGITPASPFIQTGPVVIDSKNIDKIIALNKRGI